MTSIWISLSTLHYDARSTTHQIYAMWIGNRNEVSGQTVGLPLKVQEVFLYFLKHKDRTPIGFHETSIGNYHSTLCDIPQERRPHLRCCGSTKSRFGHEIFDTLQHIHHLHWQFSELWLCLFNDAEWGLRECCLAAKCWWVWTWPIVCLLRPDHFRRPVFLWLVRTNL